MVVLYSGKREHLYSGKVYSVMIGTTEWVECKEKAVGIIADWLQVLAIIIGEITGVIQGKLLDYCIRGKQYNWKN